MLQLQPFGRTGHQSTRTIFGAAALGNVTQDEADRTLEVLLEHGVNHIDVAASYGGAEDRIGPWMDRYRDHFFLATKTGERSYEKARESIHRSLDRMRVSYVDLLQLHNLVDPIEWDQALSPGGAIDAAVEARDQGLVRFVGVTGHGTSIAAMHLRSLQRFDPPCGGKDPFDSVLLPYSFVVMQNERYAADFERLVEECIRKNVAVQTIKSIALRPWWGREHTTTTWYEPMTEQVQIDAAVHWVLARPGVFLNTASDVELLPKVLDAAGRFTPDISAAEAGRVLARLDATPIFV